MAILAQTDGYVVKDFETIEECLSCQRDNMPDAIILDVQWPLQKEETEENFSRLKQAFSNSYIVILFPEGQSHILPNIMRWNADGYIMNNVSDKVFLGYLHLVLMGEKIIPASEQQNHNQMASRSVLGEANGVDYQGDLSPRELNILGFLVHGASNKYIARQLDIAETTVKAHLKAILRKLNVSNRTQAATWAVIRGMC